MNTEELKITKNLTSKLLLPIIFSWVSFGFHIISLFNTSIYGMLPFGFTLANAFLITLASKKGSYKYYKASLFLYTIYLVLFSITVTIIFSIISANYEVVLEFLKEQVGNIYTQEYITEILSYSRVVLLIAELFELSLLFVLFYYKREFKESLKESDNVQQPFIPNTV